MMFSAMSIRTRLTVSYAICATATLAILFAVGYKLLQAQLSDGLDNLIIAQFKLTQARLGADVSNITSDVLETRMRESSDYSSTLFYFEIEAPGTGISFRSSNLLGRPIPDVRGKRVFDAFIEGIGEVRAHEFLIPPFDVTIATPTLPLRQSMAAYRQVCFALLIAMLLVSLGIGFGLSKYVLKPLRQISETAIRIRSDNLTERIPVAKIHDEISDLARLLNQMFNRLEIAFEQVHRFADEASHELKTPLTLIRLHAENMLSDPSFLPVHIEAVIIQLEELQRLNQIIDELLFLSRAEAEAIPFNIQPHDPADFLEAFKQDAIVLSEHYQCHFELEHIGQGNIAYEDKWIRQVLLNVLTNALHVSPPNGIVSLTSAIQNDTWTVSISDQGPGLKLEQQQKMFDRFVRYHQSNRGDRGSGLGLAICKKIIELHDGRIYAHSNPAGSGLRVTFELQAER